MSSRSKLSISWLLDRLQRGLDTFGDDVVPLSLGQTSRFIACSELLKQPANSFRGPERTLLRYRTAQARLAEVFLFVGCEVFTLLSLTTTTSTLSRVKTRELSMELYKWWSTAARPTSLIHNAKDLCEIHGVQSAAAQVRIAPNKAWKLSTARRASTRDASTQSTDSCTVTQVYTHSR